MMIARRIALASLTFTLLSFAPRTVAAQPEDSDAQARIHFESGRLHYGAGRFHEAATEFERAYALSDLPELLYNLYLAYRDANELESAAKALAGYLDRVRDQPNRAALEARLAVLERHLESGAPHDSLERAPDDEDEIPSLVSRAEEAESSPARRPLLGPIALASAGGALALAALGPGLAAKRIERDLDAACPSRAGCDPSLAGDVDRMSRLGAAADAFWIAGAAAAVGGVVWMIVRRAKTGDPDAPRISGFCDAHGCMFAMGRSF